MNHRTCIIIKAWFFFALLLTGSLSASGEELAQPGFMGRANMKASVFGFGSTVTRIAPGIWGSLMLTDHQAQEFKAAWEETWGKRIDGQVEAAQAKELEIQFQMKRSEILSPEQVQFIRQINVVAEEVATVAREAGGGVIDLHVAATKLREMLVGVLTSEQFAAWEKVGEQTP